MQKMHITSKRRPSHAKEPKPLYSTKHRSCSPLPFANEGLVVSNICHCILILVTRYRSLNDKNKILLTSFFLNDIPKILNHTRTKDKTHNKTARMYADISSFLEGVCKDIKIMYPSTSGDYQYVQRLFTRLMDSSSSTSSPENVTETTAIRRD